MVLKLKDSHAPVRQHLGSTAQHKRIEPLCVDAEDTYLDSVAASASASASASTSASAALLW